jgi:predicted solute-binding protein
MYVDDYTRDYGEIGRKAIHQFLGDAQRAGYVDKKVNVTFVD